MLKGKHIILSVTGSIAAYKAAVLLRLLIKNGAEVQVLMTALGKQFISPLTLATLSKKPILVEFFNPENGQWNSHVDLGKWANLMLVAPATANTIAKMANGIADNLVLTTYLSATCPVFIAPAMDLDMYKHSATQKNIEILKSFGNFFIEPAEGELASGLIGKGRMAEPEEILQVLTQFFQTSTELKGKTFLVTAGPTIEKIDAVRFISNHSSGKMGYSVAEELANRGARVILVSGQTNLSLKNSNIDRINVLSAAEMLEKCATIFPNVDGAIMSAAVADYTIENPSEKKIKHSQQHLTLTLVPTADIACELGKMKTEKQLLVGFALETDNEIENAFSKLKKKNFDAIILNSLNDKGAGFQFDTNKISIIDKNHSLEHFELKPKTEVAKDIVNKIVKML